MGKLFQPKCEGQIKRRKGQKKFEGQFYNCKFRISMFSMHFYEWNHALDDDI